MGLDDALFAALFALGIGLVSVGYVRHTRWRKQSLARQHELQLVAARAAFGRGDYAEAAAFYKQLVAAREDLVGAWSADLAILLYSLSVAYMHLDRDADAVLPLKRALYLCRQEPKRARPVREGLVLAALARVALVREDSAEARERYEAALSWSRGQIPRDAIGCAQALEGLGTTAELEGDDARAERAYRSALDELAGATPPAESRRASPYRDAAAPATRQLQGSELRSRLHERLGALALGRCDRAQAEHAYREALGIAERTFGASSSRILGPLQGLALASSVARDHAEATRSCERAIEIAERSNAPGDATNAWALLGSVRHAAGDAEGSRRAFDRALALAEETLDEDSPALCLTLRRAAAAFVYERRLGEAERLYRRAAEIARRAKSRGRPLRDEPDIANGLAYALCKAGKLAEAEALSDGAIERTQARAREGSAIEPRPHLLGTMGEILLMQGRLVAARAMLHRAMRGAESRHDERIGALIRANWAALLLREGDRDGAEAEIARALEAIDEHCGTEHPVRAMAQREWRERLEAATRR